MKRHHANPDDLERALRVCLGSFLFAGFFSLFINVLMLAPSLYMLQVYDRVLNSQSEATLIMLSILLVLAFAVMAGLESVRSRILVRVGARLDMLLNERLFQAMFDRTLRGQGGSSAQPLNDLLSLRQFLTGNGLFAFFDAPWTPVYLLVLYLLHPWFFWLAIVGVLILSGLAVANELATKKPLAIANDLSVMTGNYVAANLRNAEVLEAMGMLGAVRNRWLERHRSVLSLQATASDRSGTLTATSKMIRQLLQSLMLGLGAYLTIQQQSTAGAMIPASILAGRAMAPIDMLIGTWRGFLSARSAYRRLQDLVRLVPPKPRYMNLPPPKGHFEVEQLVVVPPGGSVPVLKGVSFSVTAGESVGIIGPSAAGKSSLARAMLGVWPLAAGKVRLDGAEIGHWNREQLGPAIGYLPQDIELFAGTVSENIARFGEVDPEEVVRAAQKAGVHELVLKLPNGYDTPIGEAGAVLSGGQRQRIGLARALYGKPILIVLDEPNSNLDDQGDAALLQAIARLKQDGATVFIITHKPSVLNGVDKILVLRDGAAQNFGPREQVLAQFARPTVVARPALTVAGQSS